MKLSSIALSLTVLLVTAFDCGDRCAAEETVRNNALQLNNEGVYAQNRTYVWKDNQIVGELPNLKDADYEEIIKKFENAHRTDPTLAVALENLAIAHNNYALFLGAKEGKLDECLTEIHKAIYLDPVNDTTFANYCGVLYKLDKHPNTFEDRVELGDKALAKKDLEGAIVEYAGALGLKQDEAVRKKLDEACDSLRGKDNEADERSRNLLGVESNPTLQKQLADMYKLMAAKMHK